MSEPIEAISGLGSNSAAELMMDYAIAMTRQAMELQAELAEGMVDLMSQPQQQPKPLPPIMSKGDYIDTYA